MLLLCVHPTQVRDEDEEVFEMNPIEYIRRDIEGGDSDTRRRSAADLVKALTEAFETEVTALFTGYVAALLQVGAGVLCLEQQVLCMRLEGTAALGAVKPSCD